MEATDYPKMKLGRPRSINITDIKAYQKEYYFKNIEKTKGHIPCEICRCLISKSNKYRHFKTSTHLQNLQNLAESS